MNGNPPSFQGLKGWPPRRIVVNDVMLSTLVLLPPTTDGAPALGALVRTLAALVPFSIEGLVRDVTVVAAGDDDGLRRVADHAGCAYEAGPPFAGAFKTAVDGARSETVFVLRAGATLDRGMVDEIAALLGPGSGPIDAVFLLRQTAEGWARLFPATAPVVGIMAPRRRLGAPVRDFDHLVRQFRRGKTLASRAQMALS